jgi:hypothetical protein
VLVSVEVNVIFEVLLSGDFQMPMGNKLRFWSYKCVKAYLVKLFQINITQVNVIGNIIFNL